MENGSKITVTFRLDRKIHEAIGKWQNRQTVKPTKTAVFETALRQFLGIKEPEEKGKR